MTLDLELAVAEQIAAWISSLTPPVQLIRVPPGGAFVVGLDGGAPRVTITNGGIAPIMILVRVDDGSATGAEGDVAARAQLHALADGIREGRWRPQLPHCSGCGKEIDPRVCQCGFAATDHEADHPFVPMGCDCLRDDEDPS